MWTRWLIVCSSFAGAPAPAQTIIHVHHAAPPGGDGAGWAAAFRDLQDGLAAAAASGPAEVWVAAGVYRPDRGTFDRGMSFELRDGVRVLGGFAGTEVAADQRDPAIYATILSGDLGNNDGPDFSHYADNSYHVVTAQAVGGSAWLDGFTIRGGNASNLGGADSVGGGLTVRGGATPLIRNCVFERNQATFGGAVTCFASSPVFQQCVFRENAAQTSAGAMFHYDRSRPILSRCRFEFNSAALQAGAVLNALDSGATFVNCWFGGNRAAGFGGGAVLNNVSPSVFVNCVFTGNQSLSAVHGGGGMRNEGSAPLLVNCTFSLNVACVGGGMYNFNASHAVLRNCILWGNLSPGGDLQLAQVASADGAAATLSYSIVQAWPGEPDGGNNGSDPGFVDPDGADDLAGTADDNLRLTPGSSAIDSGSNAGVTPDVADLDDDADRYEPTPYDADDNPRFVDDPGVADTGIGPAPVVDRGAYEYVSVPPPCLGDLDGDGDVDLDDLTHLLSHFGTSEGATTAEGDIEGGDGDVDIDDLSLLLSRFGTMCP